MTPIQYLSRYTLIISVRTKKSTPALKSLSLRLIHSEDDIINIINNQISEGSNTTFYNFKPKEIRGDWKNYELNLKRFILYPSGKGFVTDITCHDFNNRKGVLELTIPISPEEEDIPLQVNGEFRSPGFFIFNIGYLLANMYFPNARHCHICKWHSTTRYLEHICKL